MAKRKAASTKRKATTSSTTASTPSSPTTRSSTRGVAVAATKRVTVAATKSVAVSATKGGAVEASKGGSAAATKGGSQVATQGVSLAATKSAAVTASAAIESNKKRKIASLKAKEDKAMFGKGKKSRQTQSNGSKSNNVLDMFLSIAEDLEDPNTVINLEGIATLGEKLGIDVTEDVRILVLLWKMDCKEKPGNISLTEWTNGCESLNIVSFDSMIELLPTLELGFLENSAFKDFYKFCFKFNLSGTHRTLPMEMVVELLQLVLKDRDPHERVPSLCKFLQQPDSPYTSINMDQWCSFFDFNSEVGDDISQYDEGTSAWPVLIDEFVDYLSKGPAP